MFSIAKQNIQLHHASNVLKCCCQSLSYFHFSKKFGSISKLQEGKSVTKIALARQPVPDLEQTLSKYLRTVQPFLLPEEYKVTEKLVLEFKQDGGTGQKLQAYLIEKAEKEENWLSEWWLNSAYLEYRSPVTVWSSPGLVFPSRTFNSIADQLTYAANIISAALMYKKKIDGNELPQEMHGKDPLDMSQYKKIFGTCRIPRPKRDELSYNTESNHIVVIHNNNIFKFEILNDDQCMLSVEEIYDNLLNVVENSLDKVKSVGILTSEHRDTWAHCYQILKKIPENEEILKEIRSSLFIMCLDNVCDLNEMDARTRGALQTIHGGGSKCNGANRWFDKTIQFIVNRGGEVGLTYEHSPAEGQPIAVMTDYIINVIENQYVNIDTLTFRNFPLKIRRMNFIIPKELDPLIRKAEQNLDSLVNDLVMSCFTYQDYGKSLIKSFQVSPDSYIQMAQQYAFYRLHNIPGAHYESASTRKFLYGRTETIRSCSLESIEFAKTMLNKGASKSEKKNALSKAITAHKMYTTAAMNGLGVDRHLLGLRLAAKELGCEVPQLFSDIGYIRSSHMRISTSQVAAKCDAFMCYGPLVQNGYACCYNPRDSDMNFALAAFQSGDETDVNRFKESLEYSLNDMKNLLVSA